MVVWERNKDILNLDIKSRQIELDQLMDQDWHVDSGEGSVRASLDLGESNFVDVNIATLLSPAGSSWRTAMFSGDAEAKNLLKQYLRKIYSLTSKKPILAIDIVQNKTTKVNTILRQRITPDRTGKSFEDLFSKVREQFSEDAKEIVTGISSRSHTAEVQLLFGTSTVIERSPQPGDIIDHGIFFSLDSRVGISYGINRLICTNGATTPIRFINEDGLAGMRDDALHAIGVIAGWFQALPTQKVGSIRELSVLLDKFPSRVLNAHWKRWSEKVDLKELTYFEVVNDITSSANAFLGESRQTCLNIGQRFEVLKEHKCPVCSAHVGEVQA